MLIARLLAALTLLATSAWAQAPAPPPPYPPVAYPPNTYPSSAYPSTPYPSTTYPSAPYPGTGTPAANAPFPALSGMPPAPPPPAGPLVPLPMMSEKQVRQLVSDVAAHLEMSTPYRRTSASEGLPPYPPNVTPAAVLAADAGDLVRIGFVILPRRLPQLWIEGLARRGDRWVAGGDAADVKAAARTVLQESSRILGRMRLSDLEARTVLLSYVDADAALFVLRAMGYAAVTETEPLPKDDWYKGEDPAPAADAAGPIAASAQSSTSYGAATSAFGTQAAGGPRFPAIKNLPTTISFERLPLIVRVPSTEPRNLGLVGAEPQPAANSYYYNRDSTTSSAIPSAATQLSETVAAGTQELLVLYHPDYPEQLGKVRALLQESIDRPARQVYIEGLVVEVNRGNLDKLGVQWAAQKGQGSLYLGSTSPVGQAASALSVFRNSLDSVGDIEVFDYGRLRLFARIEALVSESRAEVLSRPSVITLDNRQATIRVGTDLPVAESKGSDRSIGYTYRSIPTGILLNVRPRVSEDGQEISMLIDATVSERAPADDLRVIDPDTNAIVVQAPAVQTRRVQTYARIRDNMPLIIGGLMSKTSAQGYDRVPLLGRIPLLGALFGSTQAKDDVREVIIVLTPSVVSEAVREAKAQQPRDHARYDVAGTALFKEKYRIGTEDVLDSSPLRHGERYLRLRRDAERAVDRDARLAAMPEIAPFLGPRVPGEEALVAGMMFRMLARLDAAAAIPFESLRVFQREGTLPRPVALARLLGGDPAAFFQANPGKALVLTFREAPAAGGADDLFVAAFPEVTLVDAGSRDAWRRMLWEMNQPDARGARHSILLQSEDDLRRLRTAVATRNAIEVNGGEDAMTLDRWVAGRMVNLPEVGAQWERIVDARIARLFFLGEHGYAASMRDQALAIERFDRVLAGPAAPPR